MRPAPSRFAIALLLLIPLLFAAWVWASPLSFVPVPWPDDSAFYFVGRELFKWPPRWVMLPQAPFEPTYRIFNFNTMPLYPFLLGLGRLVGLDGIHALKFWPLGAFGLSGALLGTSLYLAGLPLVGALAAELALVLDPGSRWAATLVRPESLIGLLGLAIVLGLTFGFPKPLRFRGHGLWHPVSACLALAAYAHFNAVHLLFAVVLAYAATPAALVGIAWRTAVYLSPWVVAVLCHPLLFAYQMRVQWTRLLYHNDWLDSFRNALHGVYQDMGSPLPWPPYLYLVSYVIWGLILGAMVFGIAWPLAQIARQVAAKGMPVASAAASASASNSLVVAPVGASSVPLLPAAGWLLGSVWLWENKPEVWFTYYLHVSAWTFAGIALCAAWRMISSPEASKKAGMVAGMEAGSAAPLSRVQVRLPLPARTLAMISLWTLALSFLIALPLFARTDLAQLEHLEHSVSWHWPVYEDWFSCIDAELVRIDSRLGHPRPFRVWGPTFPDILIELSRRHPDWELTRTNDFWDRAPLAVQHGRDVEAVVVTETINLAERDISAVQPASNPEIKSIWMTWETHFLNQLWREPGWKPQRYLCQRGRWQGFIFSN